MRYAAGHKEETRRKIVEVAAKRFREQGIEGVGLASLMADADLTHGGFYAHFSSKEELVKAAVQEALDQSLIRLARNAEKSGKRMESFVRSYLSPVHRDHPGEGCVVAALAAEIARHPTDTKAELDLQVKAYVETFDRWLGGNNQSTAIALYGLMSGTLQLARACSDAAYSDQILASGVAAALTLIKGSSHEHS